MHNLKILNSPKLGMLPFQKTVFTSPLFSHYFRVSYRRRISFSANWRETDFDVHGYWGTGEYSTRLLILLIYINNNIVNSRYILKYYSFLY